MNLLNKIFILECVFFSLIVTGVLPRETAIFLTVSLVVYAALAPLEDATTLFVRSIPLFIAIPIAAEYDNLNAWRILSIVIFSKWFLLEYRKFNIINLKYALGIKKLSKPSKLLLILLIFAILSVIPAQDGAAAVTRIIYFVNLSLIGIVAYRLTSNNEQLTKRLVKNIAIPTIIVTVAGYIQLASTYFVDIYQFMRIWGEGIQLRQFGTLWSDIAVRLGNTWFAYYGDQLSLRVFSLFPDSHSFPQFVLLGLPAIFAIALFRAVSSQDVTLKKLIRTRAGMPVVWIPAMFLIIILSGTRGIWAASIGVLVIISGVVFWLYRTRAESFRADIFKYISLYMLVFFLLFAVAYPIFVSPQFLLSKGDWGLFGERIKSIVDFGETSNSQRIEIWKASLESIKDRPLLGVGIGNFPVVLGQKIFLARAGSSAHNLYLHIAAEMGVLALVTAVWFLWAVFRKTYENFMSEQDPFLTAYWGTALLFIPWVLIYSLTDVALFDERAFLLLVVTITLILSNKKSGLIAGSS